MNKIYLFSLLILAPLACIAADCNQYANPADKKSCLELNSLINQTEQNSNKVYNDSVARAQSNLQKGQPSQPTAPAAVPTYQVTPTVTQPSVQQPVPQKPPQSQQPKRTRIYY